MFSVAIETQKCFPFVILSGYEIFRNAVNDMNLFRSACKVTHIFLLYFYQICILLTDFNV